MVEYTKGLHAVADRVWAWLAPDGGWGWSNAGLVEGQGESFLIDTLFDLRLTHEMLDRMSPVLERSPLTGALNTHANGDHCYGNELLGPDVTIYATRETGHEIHDVPPELIAGMLAADFDPPLSEFLHHCFGPFDFSGITVRAPDVEFEEATIVDLGGRAVHLVPLGPAHTAGDSVAYLPDSGVVFAGDLLFVNGTPLTWVGAIDNWVAACNRLIAWEPKVVVPGHGPVTDAAGIAEMRDYLVHVREQTDAAIAAGQTWCEAADRIDLGRFAALPEAERVVVTVYQYYLEQVPETLEATTKELFERMATWRLVRGATG